MAYTLVPTELIVDGAITSAKLDTNIAISGTLGVTGELTLATHLVMGDNDKIKIGTGGDLEIYHDGSNSYISNSTGNIYLGDTNGAVHIQAKLNEESIICAADGAVTLYHDNAVKLATSSSGVSVTGTVTADGLTVDTTTLVVDATNNRVGIGTASPAASLDVTVTGSTDALNITGNNVTDFNFVANPPEFNLEDTSSTSGTKRARITVNDNQFQIQGLADDDQDVTHYILYSSLANGNVSIGTATPAAKLHVVGSEVLFDNTGGDFTLKLNTNAVGDKNEIIMGDTSTPLAKFGVGGTANDIITGSDGQDFNIGTAGGGRAINFSTDNFASVEMKLDGGNLSIGNTNSNTIVTINEGGSVISGGNAINGSTMKGLTLRDTNNTNSSLGVWFGTNGTHWSGISGQRTDHTSTWGTHLAFYTHEDATNDLTYTRERMRISSNGSIGVGTTDSTYSMSLQNIVSNDVLLQIKNTTANEDTGIFIDAVQGGAATNTRIGHSVIAGNNLLQITNPNGHAFYTGTSSLAERMRIDSSGGVGIAGTCAASRKLHVYGITRMEQPATSNSYQIEFNNPNGEVGSITSSGSATSYATSSDYRLKENIEPIQNGLQRLKQLNPVQFDWKVDGTTSEGFIAHEAQEIFPDAVGGEKDGEKMQSMDYGRITPLLVKAIQEQQTIIDDLKTRIETLEG